MDGRRDADAGTYVSMDVCTCVLAYALMLVRMYVYVCTEMSLLCMLSCPVSVPGAMSLMMQSSLLSLRVCFWIFRIKFLTFRVQDAGVLV